MKIETIEITPKLAKEWLEDFNTNNRPIKKSVVRRYALDMEKGSWHLETGESIKFASDNTLLDGQHRLMAIVKANTPIKMLVVTGLDRDTFKVLDTGINRNASDVFSVENIKYSGQLPAIINAYIVLKDGTYTGHRYKLTNQDILEVYSSNPDFWDKVVTKSNTLYNRFEKVLPTSIIGGFLAATTEIDEVKSYKFMSGLCTGENIMGTVIYSLRKVLVKDKLSVYKRLPRPIKFALIIKAWNLFTNGKTVKRLTFDKSKQEYPKLKR